MSRVVLVCGASLSLLCLLLIGLSLFLREPQISDESGRVALVLERKGAVSRRPFMYSQWIALGQGDAIYERDEIKTGEDGSLKLKFITEGQELTFSPNSLAEIKRRSLKMTGGRIQNSNEGTSPFDISVGNMKIVFEFREASLLEGNGEDRYDQLLDDVWLKLRPLLDQKSIERWEVKRERLVKDLDSMMTLWLGLKRKYEDLKRQGQRVNLALDEESGVIRAQVSKGVIGVEVDGQVRMMRVGEGEGLSVGLVQGDVTRVKLLREPKALRPSAERLFNVEELKLTWMPIKAAKSYRLQVSKDLSFKKDVVEVELSEPSYAVPIELSEGWLHWRVWGVDDHGFDGLKATASVEMQIDKTPPALKVDFLQP